MSAVHNRGHHLQIAGQFSAHSWRGFLWPLRFEKQRGIIQNAFADRGRALPPGGIQLARFARIAMMLGKDRGHALAILQTLPRHRHQKLHRRLRRDLPLAHLLLDGLRQQFHQRQSPRHPAHAAIKSSCQLIQAKAETLLQLLEQPAYFQRGFLLAKAQRTIQQHGRRFAHRPHHRLHRVPPQLLQRRDPLVAVDHHVPARLTFSRHHHNGRLLAGLRQRRQQPPLPRRVTHTQMLPRPIELMKLQLHRQTECTGILALAQYVRIKCASVSSAGPALERAPALAGTRHNRNAATDFAAGARSARSTPAGRMSARKKMFLSDYPRGLVICLWLWPFPSLDPFPVAPALVIAFRLSRCSFPVSLLRFPPRPLPRLLTAPIAAIPLSRLLRSKLLLTPFEQTTPQARLPCPALPPPRRLLFARCCTTLWRAHGR